MIVLMLLFANILRQLEPKLRKQFNEEFCSLIYGKFTNKQTIRKLNKRTLSQIQN